MHPTRLRLLCKPKHCMFQHRAPPPVNGKFNCLLSFIEISMALWVRLLMSLNGSKPTSSYLRMSQTSCLSSLNGYCPVARMSTTAKCFEILVMQCFKWNPCPLPSTMTFLIWTRKTNVRMLVSIQSIQGNWTRLTSPFITENWTLLLKDSKKDT